MKNYRFLLLLLLLDSGCTVIKKDETTINPKSEQKKTTHASEPPNLIAKGELPVLITRQFKFTEGPAVDRAGNIYFTDQPNNKIWKYNTEGKLSLFLDKAGRSNGLYVDAEGNIIACADEQNQLWSISPKKRITVLVKSLKGKKLNGPNDVWVSPNGDIYFTDPYYQRYYWKRRTSELDGEKVYVLKKGSKDPIVAASIFKKPNGIIGTPDGKYVYVADADDNKTYKFEVASDGTLKNAKLFVEQGSDGMTIDSEGNIYLTGIGITIYDPQGNKIQHIDIDEPWTANVCFGGINRDMLFITASTAVYSLKMKVKGAY